MTIGSEPATVTSRRRRAIAVGWPAVVGLIVLAANQRPAVASIGPVLDDIRHGLQLSGTAAAVLTAAPVVCFGALAPLGDRLSRWLGMNGAIAALSGLLLVGLVVRLGPDAAALFLGTVIAAAAIAAMNVLLPALVRFRWPERTGLMMGVYTLGVTGAAALAAGVTVPLEHELGGGWRGGLAPWAVLAALGLLAWMPQARQPDVVPAHAAAPSAAEPRAPADPAGPRRAAPTEAGVAPVRRLRRDRLAWLVTGYFGLQSAGFYAVLTWLPTLFIDHGLSPARAGALLSLSAFTQTGVALVTPSLATRSERQGGLVLASTVLTALGFLLLLLAPVGAAYPAVIILGIGQGSSFPLALTILVLRAPDHASITPLSAMAQSIGYLLAALGPLLVGLLHTSSGGWTLPMAFLLALMVPQLGCGVLAGRPRSP